MTTPARNILKRQLWWHRHIQDQPTWRTSLNDSSAIDIEVEAYQTTKEIKDARCHAGNLHEETSIVSSRPLLLLLLLLLLLKVIFLKLFHRETAIMQDQLPVVHLPKRPWKYMGFSRSHRQITIQCVNNSPIPGSIFVNTSSSSSDKSPNTSSCIRLRDLQMSSATIPWFKATAS